MQNRWTVPAAAWRRAPPATGAAPVPACVVAAVALAVRARDPRADLAVGTGPALAYVWDAVFGSDRSGHDAATRTPCGAAARAGSWSGRAAARPRTTSACSRMRELARWNDERGRTRDDVVAALGQGGGPGGCAGRAAAPA